MDPVKQPQDVREHIALVTGTLAEPSVRALAKELGEHFKVQADVIVLNIQVAALMTPHWVQRKLRLPEGPRPGRLILPGYCRGDLAPIAKKLGVPVQSGPRNLHDLPLMFGPQQTGAYQPSDAPYNIEIIAEINHAAQLPPAQILQEAESLVADGADVIDIGCDPQADRPAWNGVGEVVSALRDRGIRVSVDSFHPQEVRCACRAGAELVLSVHSGNCEAAAEWGAEVVVIPDDPHGLKGLDRTIRQLDKQSVRFRIDPVIEPIGIGFAQSLGRFLEVRRRYAEAPMMMGIGNLTEMTGVDSAAVNALLLGFCQELNIQSVLTTQVINWTRSSVREIDIARRMTHHAVTRGTVPKHQDERLVMLRDPRLQKVDESELSDIASRLTDDNIRLFADIERRKIHAMNRTVHAAGDDPYAIFDELGIEEASHAFYLGYELSKAMTAVTLAKNYTQDEPLNWGVLTQAETSHYERRKSSRRRTPSESDQSRSGS